MLVVAAHPDDEILGCGGTVAVRVDQGWTAHLMIVASGIAGRFADPSAHQEEFAEQRVALEHNARRAASTVGFSTTRFLNLADNRLDTVPRQNIAHAIDSLIDEVRPDTIYTHHPGDYNWDHGVVFDAVMMAARHSPGEFAPTELYTFEVGSSTERAAPFANRAFLPNTYVDISAGIERKKAAMQIYESEYRPYPHPRSVEGLEYSARKRGLDVGLEYAEAFCLIRRVER
ncbi:MAG: PIG-L family deacetylase [Deltaproteobacteria bacterium]|nr:PIG-L family deacetylase [Deltaproteobacteria bacterium]MCB9478606.1 PIG-L family deacetylase [Deltaproteobacteria bacterium]MCB9490100.1 PIG-L family deacetylase [Deltaproteobacteria bacterium]